MKKKIKSSVSIFLVAAMILTLFQVISVQTVYASDEYDDLRLKYKQMLTGGTSYNSNDTDIANCIVGITSEAQGFWDSMDKAANRTYLWSDRSDLTSTTHMKSSYYRLSSMALAYCTYGSTLYNNTTLRDDIISAMDWMYTNWYNESISTSWGNWYHLEISAPKSICDTVILLYDELTSTQITNYMNAVEHCCYDATHVLHGTREATAANRVEKIINIILRGIIIKDSNRIAYGSDNLSPVFDYVPYEIAITQDDAKDGFYYDGSFIQHRFLPYTGGYGYVFVGGLCNILELLDESTWEVTDSGLSNMYEWVYNTFEPIVYKGRAMDSERGRDISYEDMESRIIGRKLVAQLMRMSSFVPAEHANNIRKMVKYWLTEDSTLGTYDYMTIPQIILAQDIINNSSTREELVKHKQYPMTDRAVHLRPGFGFGVSMSSSRIWNYESFSDNLKAWYTAEGMTYLYNNDIDQYDDNFWCTVDHYRMPGTTVDTKILPNEYGHRYLSPNNWVGGTEMSGLYGVSGMERKAYGCTLNWKKSWYMFDDEIVCLGSDINSIDSRVIETIVENRKLNDTGNNTLKVNGVSKDNSLGWSETMSDVNYIHLEGNVAGSDIGYYFPGKATVKAKRESRTDNWYNYNTYTGLPANYTRNYMTMWFDHGTNPSNKAYSYVILPNKSDSQLSDYSSNPDITILENSSGAQAVKENTLNITAVNFWNDAVKTVDKITSNKKASVMLKESDEELELSVSDPTQKNTGTVDIEINKSASSIISKDQEITVTQLSPTIKLSVNVDEAMGKTFKASFNTLLVDENFNNMIAGNEPEGWSIGSSGGTVTVDNVPDVNNKSMKLYDDNPVYGKLASKSSMAQTGLITAEFKIMLPQSVSYFTAKLNNTTGCAFWLLTEGTSNLRYKSSSGSNIPLQDYVPNTWYTIKIVADTEKNKCDIYIDGVKKASNVDFYSSVPSINQIQFGTSSSNTGTMYVDDVKVKSSLSLYPSADSFVRDGSYADANYGQLSVLTVKKDTIPDLGYNRKAYLKFNLNLLDRSSVERAKLRLYVSSAGADTARTIKIYGNNDESWSEDTITWNNAPSGSTYITSIDVSNTAGAWYEADITDYLNNHMNDKRVSFMLVNKAAGSSGSWVEFGSSNAQSSRPEIIIN